MSEVREHYPISVLFKSKEGGGAPRRGGATTLKLPAAEEYRIFFLHSKNMKLSIFLFKYFLMFSVVSASGQLDPRRHLRQLYQGQHKDIQYGVPHIVFRFLICLLIEGRAIICLQSGVPTHSIGEQSEVDRILDYSIYRFPGQDL